MLKALRDRFFKAEETPSADALLQRASALLMLEIAHADDDYDVTEKNNIITNIKKTFSLSDNDTQHLLDVSESEREDLLSLDSLTQIIKNELEMPQRIQIVELLWSVAYADGRVSQDEDYMVRKLSDLLYVSHQDFIKAKIRVENKQ
jgi:uncharacterized tellurite resistance protein B-like protein